MELRLLVVWNGTSSDLTVSVEPSEPVHRVMEALQQHVGAGGSTHELFIARLGCRLNPDDTIGASGVRVGDRVELRPLSTERSDPVSQRWPVARLQVIGGPAAGQHFDFPEGHFVIGRQTVCDAVVPDPTMSSRHFELDVRPSGVSATDVSRNGTRVGLSLLVDNTLLPWGTVIEAGLSLFRIDQCRPSGSPSPSAHNGLVRFNRPPRHVLPLTERVFDVDAPPARSRRPRLTVISAVGGLMMGLPLLLVGGTSRTIGIVMLVVSPILAIGSVLENWWSGARGFRRAKRTFEAAVEEVRITLSDAVREEVEVRRKSAPDASDLLDRAVNLRPSLWERRPVDSDFLSLSVGWCDQPSVVSARIRDGGDAELRAWAATRLDAPTVALNVPMVVSMPDAGVVGLCGDVVAVDGLVRWIVGQIATLHSPRDVVLVGVAGADEHKSWGWMSWLPHIGGEGSPLDAEHLVFGAAAGKDLLTQLRALVEYRRGQMGVRSGRSAAQWPAVVVLLSERAHLDRSDVTPLLEMGPDVGVYTVWSGSVAEGLPGECGAVIEVSARPPTVSVVQPRLALRIGPGKLDQLAPDRAETLAMSLAPVRDVGAGGARSQTPRRVSLLEVLGLEDATVNEVLERWRRAPLELAGPIGRTASGVFRLDVRRDGPHALVGGTTDSGKSELLRTIIASLAASHPPDRLTFFLIDYKAGTAFKDAVRLPHTVGLLTDLDGHLVDRALLSLKAELVRREHIHKEFGADKLEDLERKSRDHAPPALLLVLDEMSALVKQHPEFIDGVIDIGRRGRAFGIHLLLATQKPTDIPSLPSIMENIKLKMVLRMSPDESDRVIGSKDAAEIPHTLKGRALVKIAQMAPTEVQVAWAGGRTTRNDDTGPVVRTSGTWSASDRAADDPHAVTDLQVVVDLLRAAADRAGIPPQHSPWLPPLPEQVHVSSLPASGSPTAVVFGLVDRPTLQSQHAAEFDLIDDGHLLVYGGPRSGKTTLLRTLAAALSSRNSPDDLHLYALDFATRGLGSLAHLPHIGSVVFGDDLERTKRLIVRLERLVAQRREAFIDAGVADLERLRDVKASPMPRVVVFLDGMSGFVSEFERIDFGEWIDRLVQLVADGRAMGIHWVITADRCSAVNGRLSTVIPSKVVLRMTNEDEYVSLGLDKGLTRGAGLRPGRGFVGATEEMQVACVSLSSTGDAQATELERLGRELQVQFPNTSVPSIGSLPRVVSIDDLVVAGTMEASFAIGDTELEGVQLSLRGGSVLVAGPIRSGRSTALRAIVSGLYRSTPSARLFLLAPRRSLLTGLDVWEESAQGLDACGELARALDGMLAEQTEFDAPVVVVVDDGTELSESSCDAVLQRIIRRGRDVGMVVVGAVEVSSALRSYSGWIPEIRRERRGVLLSPDADTDGDLLGARLPRRVGAMPPGRGYLVTDGSLELVHVAS